MGYRPPALPAPLVAYVAIPEGDAGLAATLAHIIAGIRAPNPLTDRLAAAFAEEHPELTETELCAVIFAWVQGHMCYLEEDFSATPDISDAIATPDAVVVEIERDGQALGDCAHYSALLSGLYRALGLPTALVWTCTRNPRKPDGLEHHVFCEVSTDDGTYTADAIVGGAEFGWEIPAHEQLFRRGYPV